MQRGIEKYLVQGNTEEETSFRSDVGDCIDYYFMYGGSADGVIAQIRLLTGSVPMMPLWSYGFMPKQRALIRARMKW